MNEVSIARGGVDSIDALEPLWMALHAQHRTVDPELRGIPIRTDQESWTRRRSLYHAWLSEKDAFLLKAGLGGRLVGYALAHLHEADESWDTGGRFGVLESIAVIPEMRGRGLGRALMSAVYAELRRLGVAVLEIGVLSTNAAARRFYEREGFAPWLTHYLGRIPREE
jgi:ribosomal protein S18 acetylase RimI-like enzyme